MILAGVLLKMGTYGFIRFSLPLLARGAPNPTRALLVIVLSIIGIVYGALVSLMQKDMKKLVAYSSVSHLGFCTLGIFALNPHGLAGTHLPADQPRHLDRRALLDRRRASTSVGTRARSRSIGGLSNVMPGLRDARS